MKKGVKRDLAIRSRDAVKCCIDAVVDARELVKDVLRSGQVCLCRPRIAEEQLRVGDGGQEEDVRLFGVLGVDSLVQVHEEFEVDGRVCMHAKLNKQRGGEERED